MASGAKPKKFEFVSVDAKDAARKTLDDASLLRVRRQAMRSFYIRQELARAQKGNGADGDEVKCPVLKATTAKTTEDEEIDDPKTALAKVRHQEKIWKRAAATPNPLTVMMTPQGFQALRSDFGVDISHLSAFGELEVGLFAFPTLQKDPSRILTLLRNSRPESFLALLPARYGHCNYLDDAMRCVAARMSQVFTTSTTDAFVVNLYNKALRSLTAAISSQKTWSETNVLAASQLLSIFELLNASNEAAWSKHKEGTVKLIELRGPKAYKSEFDKALLRSQAMTIVIEKTLTRQPCFFARPEWQAYFHETASHESSLDEWAYWRLFGPTSRIPNLFHDCTEFSKVRTSPEEAHRLYIQAKDLRQSVLDWLTTYNERKASLLETPPSSSAAAPTKYASLPVRAAMHEAQLPQNLRSTFVHAIMGLNIMVSLFSSDPIEQKSLQEEAQRFTNEAIDSERLAREMYPSMDPIMQWYVEQKVQVAHAFRALKYDWSRDVEEDERRISESPDTSSSDPEVPWPNT